MGYIEVEGTGRVEVTPDAAELVAFTQVTARAAVDAVRASIALTHRVLEVLDQAAVPDTARGVRPGGIHRRTRWDNDRELFLGWEASHHVAARITALDDAYRVVEALAGIEGVRTEDPRWLIDDDNPAHSRARAVAYGDAERRAKDYAAAAGVELGTLLWITDVRDPDRRPMPASRAAALVAEAGVFDPGTSDVTASVLVRFECT